MTTLSADIESQLHEFNRLLTELQAALLAVTSQVRSPKEMQALEPLQRAKLGMAVAQAIHALHHLLQRCHGRDPMAPEAARAELQCLRQYSRKVGRALQQQELRGARKTLTLDVAAANRFIDHAIPDLTQEQRAKLRAATAAVGGGGGGGGAEEQKRPRGAEQGDGGDEGAGAASGEAVAATGGSMGTPHRQAKRGKKGAAGVSVGDAAQQFLAALAAKQ